MYNMFAGVLFLVDKQKAFSKILYLFMIKKKIPRNLTVERNFLNLIKVYEFTFLQLVI